MDIKGKEQLEAFTKAKTGDYVVRIKDAVVDGGKLGEAFPTGYPNLDVLMKYENDETMKGGFRGGELVIVTGATGMGKTTFAQNLTINLSKIQIPTLWFTYEVSVNSLYNKFVRMGMDEEILLYTPKKHLTGRVDWIKAKILEAIAKFSTKVVFIDDITFLTPTSANTDSQYRIQIASIITELKSIAVEFNIIVVLMVHVRKTNGKDIEIEDTSESSAPGQKCDYFFVVNRDLDAIKNAQSTGRSRVIVKKNRPFGQLGIIKFFYLDDIFIQANE